MSGTPDIPDPSAGELRIIRRLLVGLFLIALFGAIFFARALLLPIVLAVLFALTLRPIVRGLARLGVPVGIGGVVLIVAFGAVAAGAIYGASGPVGRLVERAPAIGEEVQWKLRHLLRSVDEVQDATEQVEQITSGGNGQAGAQEVVVEQSALLTNVVGSLASAGTSVAVALVLAMFLLASGDFYQRRIVEASPRFSDKRRAMSIVRDVERQISRYLAAITVINAGLGVAIGCALWLIGLPNAYVWGIAAFLLNYLPFLGAVLGTIGVGMVALVTFDSIGYALLCPMAYFLCTTLEGNVVTPTLVGRHLSINTVSVFVTVILWVWLWGVAGAFLAVPVLVIVKVLSDHIPALNGFGRFLGTEAPAASTAEMRET